MKLFYTSFTVASVLVQSVVSVSGSTKSSPMMQLQHDRNTYLRKRARSKTRMLENQGDDGIPQPELVGLYQDCTTVVGPNQGKDQGTCPEGLFCDTLGGRGVCDEPTGMCAGTCRVPENAQCSLDLPGEPYLVEIEPGSIEALNSIGTQRYEWQCNRGALGACKCVDMDDDGYAACRCD